MRHKTNVFGMWLISIIAVAMMISTATALPEILDVFNAKYDTGGTRLDTCDTCHFHGSQNASNLNSYGMDMNGHLNIAINKGLAIIEPLDSDRDGFTNIDEIHNLTFPGNKSDSPKKNAHVNPHITVKKKGFPKVKVANPNKTKADNNVSNITIANLAPLVTATATTPNLIQKVPGFGIIVSMISKFLEII